MLSPATRALIRERLAAEVGRVPKDGAHRVALVYPSPYAVGMSSLGYQWIYRRLQAVPGVACERVFLPDSSGSGLAELEMPVSYENLRPLQDFRVLAFSMAYELELAGIIQVLEASGIPALSSERSEQHPFVLVGGPITFSNPALLAPYADAIVVGEGETIAEQAMDIIFNTARREEALASLALVPHVYVPALQGDQVPPTAACDDSLLPAHSVIRTPHTELSDMFLIETERGCSRGCRYCVMRRSTNGGMRVVDKDVVLSKIPDDARKVGLVGAAVSDHPRIVEIVRALAERGMTVGLSSLRPDRLKEEFIAALRAGGYRTLTTALDGPSQRLRDTIERRGREQNYVDAAMRAKRHGMDRIKLYLMVGLPGETEADIDECVAFISELSRIIPIALGVAPFCAKRNTPLDGQPYAGVRVIQARLDRLRRGLQGRADVRATSARWAWVEYVLSQGGWKEARAVLDAVRAGGKFADYRKAFAALGHEPNRALPLSAEPRRLAVLA